MPPAYSRYRRLRPGGEICWFGVNFPRDLKCQILSSLTVEIAFKRRKQAIKYQCWCGVNFLRDLKCQILSSLALEIAFKRRTTATTKDEGISQHQLGNHGWLFSTGHCCS